MSKYGNQPKQDGGYTLLLVAFLAVAVGGLGVVYAFNSSLNENVDNAQQQGAVETGQQAQTTTVDVEIIDDGVGAGASAAIIATDDPSYLDCLNQPNAEGVTDDQHIANCNKQLEQQQAVQQPSGQGNRRLPNGDEAFGPPAGPTPGPSPIPNLP